MGKGCLLWQDPGHLTWVPGRPMGKVEGMGARALGTIWVPALRASEKVAIGKGAYWTVLSLTFSQETQTQMLGRTFNGIHRDWMGMEAGYLENEGQEWGQRVGRGRAEEGRAS